MKDLGRLQTQAEEAARAGQPVGVRTAGPGQINNGAKDIGYRLQCSPTSPFQQELRPDSFDTAPDSTRFAVEILVRFSLRRVLWADDGSR
jgi:hypothetical protein